MQRILRSLINVTGSEVQEVLLNNFNRIHGSAIRWIRHEDVRIFSFLNYYYNDQFEATRFPNFRGQWEMPSIETVRFYFEGLRDSEVILRLRDVAVAGFYTGPVFDALLVQIQQQNEVLFPVNPKPVQVSVQPEPSFQGASIWERIRDPSIGVVDDVVPNSDSPFDSASKI